MGPGTVAEMGTQAEIEQRARQLQEQGYREAENTDEKGLEPKEYVIASRVAEQGSMYEDRLEYVITWREGY